MGNKLGGATCNLVCKSQTGSEFSEKVICTTLTNVGNPTYPLF